MKNIYRSAIILFFVVSFIYFFDYFWKDVSHSADFSVVKKLIEKNENEQALKIIDLYLQNHPQNGLLMYYKAIALKNTGRYSEALKELDKSIAIGYPDVLAYNLKAFIYGKYLNDFEKQIHYAGKALEIDPSDSESYYLKAIAYKEKGDYDMALKNIDSAIKND